MGNKIIIATSNPFVTEVKNQFITFVHNPEDATVTQEKLSKMEKVQNGYIKIGYPLGLVTIQFSGRVPLYFKDVAGNKIYKIDSSANLYEAPVYKWFDSFKNFINTNAEYPFLLRWKGYVAGFGITDPILKGDCSPPDYSLSSEDLFVLTYSFQFEGTLTTRIKDGIVGREDLQDLKELSDALGENSI